MKINNVFKYWMVLLSVVLVSCDDYNDNPAPQNTTKDHTVIVYMMANNDLYSYANDNMNKMESTWSNTFDGNCVVLRDIRGNKGKLDLIEVQNDNTVEVISPIVKTYTDMSPLDPKDMKALLLDIIDFYPSQRYSLILWSHATGWLPTNITIKSSSRAMNERIMRGFGNSNGVEMSLLQLAEGIPDHKFQNIISDACYMGTIEVAYELRNKADYLIGSPTEVWVEGIPYHTIIPLLMHNDTPATLIAANYVEYYKNKTEVEEQSASIGVVQTNQLEKLMTLTKTALATVSSTSILNENADEIQHFDRYANHIFYDFKQTMQQLVNEDNKSDFETLFQQLEQTVTYKNNTEWFYRDPYDDYFYNGFMITNNSGLSCFIPNKKHNSKIIAEYKTLSWYKDSGFELLFEEIK